MEPLSGEYPLTQLERVVFGAGSVARLGDELDRLGASRAVVVTGRTLSTSALLNRVTGALGGSVRAGVCWRAAARASAGRCRSLARARQPRAPTVWSASAAAARSIPPRPPFTCGWLARAARRCRTSPCRRRVGGGVTAALGHLTMMRLGLSTPSSMRGWLPAWVVLDPELTAETPAWLWAASGMRAVDHAWKRNPELGPVSTRCRLSQAAAAPGAARQAPRTVA